MKTTFTPVKYDKVCKISSLVGGDTFILHSSDVNFDVVKEVNDGNVFMVVKDSVKDGSVRIVNVSNGLILQRDSDRDVIKVNSSLNISF